MKRFILSLGVMFITASCGDLFMKSKKETTVDQFATCKLNTQAFANIFTEEIKADIICLEENLNLFMDVVRSDRPGTLSLKELKIYIQKNIPEIDRQLLKALPAFFEVNALMFGDDKAYISRHNVEKLISFLIVLNKEAAEKQIYKFFIDTNSITYSQHQERRHLIYTSVFNLSKILDKYLVKNRETISSINLPLLLDYFRDGNNDKDINQVIEFLFAKKAILGGNEYVITNIEFEGLISKLADLAKIIFDVKNLQMIKYSEDELKEKLKMYKADILTMETALFYDRNSHEPLFTLDQVKAIANDYFKEYAEYFEYEGILRKLKDAVLGSNSKAFSAKELYVLIDHLAYVVEQGEYFQVLYDQYKHLLKSNSAVDIASSTSNADYLTDRQKEFHKNFIRIVKDYRFYKGEGYIPYFTDNYVRTAEGVYEISIFEYIAKVIMRKYGIVQNGEYFITQEKIVALMEDYQEILYGKNIIHKGRIKNTAETITLLTTLFQNQSNGDSYISVPELTEFAMTLLSGYTLAQDMLLKMRSSTKDACIEHRPESFTKAAEQTLFSPECFRQEFSEFLSGAINDQQTREMYLEKFSEFYLKSNLTFMEQDEFLKQTEKFSRTCTHFANGEEVPMEEGDLLVVFAGILNLEQTYLRFDTNGDNILTPDELDKAFVVYGPAIEALIPAKFLKRYSKQFFQYLIKYEKLPDVQNVNSLNDFWRAVKEGGKFVGFILKSNRKRQADANRVTLSSILKTLGELSPENQNNPFDCETLRQTKK